MIQILFTWSCVGCQYLFALFYYITLQMLGPGGLYPLNPNVRTTLLPYLLCANWTLQCLGWQCQMLISDFTGLSSFPHQFTCQKYSHQKKPTSSPIQVSGALSFGADTIFGLARLSICYNKPCLTPWALCIPPQVKISRYVILFYDIL